MEALSLPIKFLLVFLLGAVIGIERQMNERHPTKKTPLPSSVLGLRTFSLISVLGVSVGVLAERFMVLSLVVGGIFGVLLICFYFFDTRLHGDPGITTELSMLYSFLIGIFVALEVIPIQLTLAITVVLVILLSQKGLIHDVIENISGRELNAFLSYAIIALVILPFLPNSTITPVSLPGLSDFLSQLSIPMGKISQIEILNPFKLWLIVALITGVDLLGYILERTIGSRKGWLVASAAGGVVSSTATTQTLAIQSAHTTHIYPLLAAAVIANLVSFFQIAVIIGTLNGGFLARLIPSIIAMIAVSGSIFFFFFRKNGTGKDKKSSPATQHTSIFDFRSAVKFAGLYLLISLLSKIALTFLGNTGFLVTVALGALIGLDAVMINTAQLAGEQITFELAVWAFILANAVNLFAKSFYCRLHGNRDFTRKFFVSMLCIVAASIAGVWLSSV